MAAPTLLYEDVRTAIEKIAQFLEHYSLLANAHATDFLVEDSWNTLLPENIQQELSNISETNLKHLSSLYPQDKRSCKDIVANCDSNVRDEEISSSDRASEDQITSACNFAIHGTGKLSSNIQDDLITNLRCDEKTEGGVIDSIKLSPNFVDNIKSCQKPLLIEWKHLSLKEFCLDAASCTIESIGLSRSYEDVIKDFRDQKPFVGTFMNEKKSHEIERMAAVCNYLVKMSDADLVIDFGSGKGYLGSYLSLQYSIPVLGIDSVSINTQSAVKRTNLLTKQWKGLINHKEREVNSVSLTKRERKLLKGKRPVTVCENSSDVFKDKTNKQHQELKSNRYVAVTMFIENVTDLNKLVFDNFPDLCLLKNVICLNSAKITTNCGQPSVSVPNNSHPSVRIKCMEEIKGDHQNFSKDDTQMECEADDVDLYEGVHQLSLDNHSSLSFNDINNQTAECADLEHNLADIDKLGETVSVSGVKTILTGLHTCGNLACTSLELFVHSPLLTTLCNVGCCYHFLNEAFLQKRDLQEGCSSDKSLAGFPMSMFLNQKKFCLGQTARKLACQSASRLPQTELQGRKLFPRAMLELLFKRQNVEKADREGKSLRGLEQQCKTVLEFLTRACEKLDIMHKVDEKVIAEAIAEFGDSEEKLAAFFQLRTLLAPCIESLIILDRACYLLEQDLVADVSIVKMFDSVISPRCYGIIATKRAE